MESEDELIERLRKAHDGEVVVAKPGGKLIVCRRPEQDEYEDYTIKLRDEKNKVAFRELVQRTCVHPSVEELRALLARFPAVCAPIASELCELAGLNVEVVVKKG